MMISSSQANGMLHEHRLSVESRVMTGPRPRRKGHGGRKGKKNPTESP